MFATNLFAFVCCRSLYFGGVADSFLVDDVTALSCNLSRKVNNQICNIGNKHHLSRYVDFDICEGVRYGHRRKSALVTIPKTVKDIWDIAFDYVTSSAGLHALSILSGIFQPSVIETLSYHLSRKVNKHMYNDSSKHHLFDKLTPISVTVLGIVTDLRVRR